MLALYRVDRDGTVPKLDHTVLVRRIVLPHGVPRHGGHERRGSRGLHRVLRRLFTEYLALRRVSSRLELWRPRAPRLPEFLLISRLHLPKLCRNRDGLLRLLCVSHMVHGRILPRRVRQADLSRYGGSFGTRMRQWRVYWRSYSCSVHAYHVHSSKFCPVHQHPHDAPLSGDSLGYPVRFADRFSHRVAYIIPITHATARIQPGVQSPDTDRSRRCGGRGQ
jgi:hypothetical protein